MKNLEDITFKKRNLVLFCLLLLGLVFWFIILPVIKDLNPSWQSKPERVYYEPDDKQNTANN